MNSAVTKATKHDGKAPKQKHVTTLCSYSWESKVSVKNMLDLLANRLNDNDWDVVFKALIVIHCLMRDGCPENVFEYLSQCPGILDVSRFRPKPVSQGMHQTKNLRSYAEYLEHKVHIFRRKQVDFTDSKSGKGLRLMNEGVAGNLLENVRLLQEHLDVLLKTKYHETDVDNHISLFSFKMLIRDLLKIFQCVNQGVISILKNYFDMDKDKATLSLQLYRKFTQQTEEVIRYLDVAHSLEHFLQFTVPKLNHAPTSLLESLEEHLRAPFSPIQSYPNSTPSHSLPIPINDTRKVLAPSLAKKDAHDFFASLDDDNYIKTFQSPASPASFSPLSTMNSAYNTSPFNPSQRNLFQTNNSVSAAPSHHLAPYQPNPFTKTAPNHGARPSIVASNPFATLRGHNQATLQLNQNQTQPQFASLNSALPPSRSTMNPFLMDAFADDHLTPQQIGLATPQPSNFANFNPPPPANNFSNLFAQHSFHAQH